MDTKRGDDAQDHAPDPKVDAAQMPGKRQEAPNYKERRDDDGAIEVENMNSANDEGAN